MPSPEFFSGGSPEQVPNEEIEQNREVIFQDEKLRVHHPLEQAIPLEEGIQLVVDNGQEISHRNQQDVPALLRAAYYALAVAKVEAEGRFTKEFWANIQMNSWPGTEKGINVFGKSPQSKEGWGKPVNLRPTEARKPESLDQNQKAKLQRTMELYLPRWEKKAQEITVFDGGVNEIKPDNEVFQKESEIWINRPDPWQERAVWLNEKFVLVVVKNPHLDGLHLVCHARKDYWSKVGEKGVVKAWQTPKGEEDPKYLNGFVESNAILLGADQIIQEAGDFHNAEIHFSGNWGFRPLEPASKEVGGREVDSSYLKEENLEQARKMEKVGVQDAWAGGDPDWHSHGHLYATRSPDKYVTLPSRPMKEVPEEWVATKPLSPEEEEKIYQLIQEKLTTWLEANCQGVKIG